MPKVSEDLEVSAVYGGNHLKAADVPEGKKFDLTVEAVSLEDMPARDGKPSRKKLVLAFAGATKTLVLNVVNAGAMAGVAGKRPAAWVGARVLLERTNVPFGPDLVPALRITKVTMPGGAFEATDDDVAFLK